MMRLVYAGPGYHLIQNLHLGTLTVVLSSGTALYAISRHLFPRIAAADDACGIDYRDGEIRCGEAMEWRQMRALREKAQEARQ